MKILALVLTALCTIACGEMLVQEDDSDLKWDQGGYFKFNSHTVITAKAVRSANKALVNQHSDSIVDWYKQLRSEGRRWIPNAIRGYDRMGREEWLNSNGKIAGFYPVRHLDDGSGRTQNRLQEGNVAADFPGRLLKIWIFPMNFTKFLFDAYCSLTAEVLYDGVVDIDACKKLSETGKGQPLHFTREYKVEKIGDSYDQVSFTSAKDSCFKSLAGVRIITRKAFEYWREGTRLTREANALEAKPISHYDAEHYRKTVRAHKIAGLRSEAMKQYELMYFMLGTAAHAIEDSFAPPHTERQIDDPRKILDICYYYDPERLIQKPSGICEHGFGLGNEPRDNIGYPGNDFWRDQASITTKAYLEGFANIAMLDWKDGAESSLVESDIDTYLDEFYFSEDREPGKGYFRCELLTK